MPELDGERSESLGHGRGIDRGPVAQDDPITNPNGVYSGMTRRSAATDGKHAEVSNMPKDMRKTGRLTHDQIAKAVDLSRGRFS